MDKKALPYIGILILVLVLGGFYLNSQKDDNESTASPSNPSSQANQANYDTITDACAKFTLEDAKKIIGNTVESNSTVAPGVDGDDVYVSTCTYTMPASDAADAKTIQTASLLVRSPKSQTGVTSNNTPFSEAKPANAQDVSGVGDKAYWNPTLGQLNVLHKGNWLIVTAGPVKASERTQDKAVEASKLIIARI